MPKYSTIPAILSLLQFLMEYQEQYMFNEMPDSAEAMEASP
jgi:hypothetical protein